MNKRFHKDDLNEKWVQYANEKVNVGKHNLLSVLRDKSHTERKFQCVHNIRQ